MTKSSASKPTPPCGCNRCHCERGPHCRCHTYNALLALSLAEFGRMVRRHAALNRSRS